MRIFSGRASLMEAIVDVFDKEGAYDMRFVK
jgi:hypothetical protein